MRWKLIIWLAALLAGILVIAFSPIPTFFKAISILVLICVILVTLWSRQLEDIGDTVSKMQEGR